LEGAFTAPTTTPFVDCRHRVHDSDLGLA